MSIDKIVDNLGIVWLLKNLGLDIFEIRSDCLKKIIAREESVTVKLLGGDVYFTFKFDGTKKVDE